MFDAVVVATGGPSFYRDAFIKLDQKALNSPTMLKAFERMSALHQYVDPNFANRDWNVATGMVINGKAGFQMMGDWALGEFNHAKKVPNKDFLCFRTPGTQGTVTYNSDVFVFFNVKDTAAQDQMAEDVMSPKVQAGFNQLKGAAPAVLGTSPSGFNACGRKAIADLAEADKNGTLMGSMSQGYAVPPAIKNAFYDVIAREFNGEITAQEAVTQLAAAAKAQY
jgi:glucose/mannose transport system substrate-binding protein